MLLNDRESCKEAEEAEEEEEEEEEEEAEEAEEAEEEEEEEEGGSGGAEEFTELFGGREDEDDAGGGMKFGAVREVQLIRRCPTRPIRARNVR
nr:unnamed protein product [Spirometra erinaceieuropaei]